MPKAKLEVLGLEVPIGLFTTYHDDGFVDSIKDHSLELIDKYCPGRTSREYNTKKIKSLHDTVVKMGARINGITMTLTPLFRSHIHIFYLDLPYEETVRVRAHEETHVVETVGRLDMLAKKILNEQRVRIDFGEIDDRVMDWREIFGGKADNKEVRAGIGAVYALHVHGIDPNHAFPDSISYGIARDLYERARLPGE